ncbi:hypothetical protein BIV57_20965 [Mangrovactinospora gilvigrisea]|uniref:N-acetyltransferase domain-containing protein n=1 Tax=Mangrovactinospora gilvigrisea TaxID=1428644 RepID=A0A1J7BQ11_9ACTN|nr:GNAT family N-acetyltransferase [Mangrovactinospora gilvigrisea]OIV35537.1 hypothetical protein BIV57_20965 [Mangrovactinospora gilvigrisea]
MIRHDLRPGEGDVEELYLAAASLPPLGEGRATARLFAALYREALQDRDDVTVATAEVGGALAGLAYGHPWRWAEQDGDPWAGQLRARLGPDAAERLDGAFALHLLVVHPDHQRGGLGRRLLAAALPEGAPRAWLLTTDRDTPASRLYTAAGWGPLGHGPDAPDGRPGLVMVLPAAPEGRTSR